MPTRPIHEPRRDDCPWCGAPGPRTRLRAPDLRHGRPGTFTLDECRACAHVFQNPRLTPEGLALYGAAGTVWRRARRRDHRGTGRAVRRYCPEPESWLDVGTGDAAFPAAVKELFPYTSFDGTDPTERVTAAAEEERIEEAYVGHLGRPGLPRRLRGRYDVVSLLGSLVRAPDARAELRAAVDAVRPGGYLVLELPDPDSAWASLLGKWWHAHTQPHHLQLLPLPNVRAELEGTGCRVLEEDRVTAHRPTDLSTALDLRLGRGLPTPLARALVTTAHATDIALAPLLSRTPFTNTYRVLAHKPL
ncbi:class I SAM-dependent methyltransferase [Streptomyces sp. NPDC006186]|jgi:SAM-dependent methyltransferase|uniref:class I SAM-dependent methyltransferase n=1 Tax=Streptomyces sp. NPDC006186 TaxID=3155248 RepID=UPI0033B9B3FA